MFTILVFEFLPKRLFVSHQLFLLIIYVFETKYLLEMESENGLIRNLDFFIDICVDSFRLQILHSIFSENFY